MIKKEDTFKKRYLSKLLTNFIALLIGVVTQALIPRGLGPKAYGDFNFLSNFFTQVIGFFDMGTSTGFYTKLSQRQEEFGLVSFYLRFSLIIILILFILPSAAQLTDTTGLLWPDQHQLFIYLASLWAVLIWASQLLHKLTDAYGITVAAEFAKITQNFLGLGIISVLFLTQQLNLLSFFIYHYVILFILCGLFVWLLHKKGFSLFRNWHLTGQQVKAYFREFYDYSHPLLLYALVGLVVGIFDRWLLQYFGGSVEQGFFSLSYKVGSLCFLFTSAMTPLLTREFSIAFGDKNISEMARLFRRYIPMLYAIAAYFACFVAVQSAAVTFILGGEKFGQAVLIVMIMAFYPIHQTYGQLSGSVFYATGNTKLYRNIGVFFMLLGIPMTYFLVAPPEKFGIGAGALGLAIKMVVLQILWVNAQLFFNSRFLDLKFNKYVAHQLLCVLIMVCLALSSDLLVKHLLSPSNSIIFNFIISGMLYTLLVGLTTVMLPALFGLQKKDISMLMDAMQKRTTI